MTKAERQAELSVLTRLEEQLEQLRRERDVARMAELQTQRRVDEVYEYLENTDVGLRHYNRIRGLLAPTKTVMCGEEELWVEVPRDTLLRTEPGQAWEVIEVIGRFARLRLVAAAEQDTAAHWMTPHSGHIFYPLAPRAKDIYIEDIAQALGRLCRYGGHVDDFYSVAQHSVLVSLLVEQIEPEHAFWALMHDAAEAYVSDLVRPLKRAPGLVAYRRIERGIMREICTRFGMVDKEPEVVTEYDRRLCVTEARYVRARPGKLWAEHHDVIPEADWPPGMDLRDLWSHKRATAEFLQRYEALVGRKRKGTRWVLTK